MSGVILVALQGEPILEEAFNVESLRSDFEVTVDSVFAIASLTKSYTATLALRQVDAGRIDLDTPIRAYLPAFNAAYSGDVTVRQLLENRSGIPHYVDIPGWFEPGVRNGFTAETFLAEIEALELRFAPGEEYYYSNANYYLLGRILEAATGESYEAVLQEEILGPLGLRDSGQIYSSGSRIVAPTYLRDGNTYESVAISNPELFRATGSQYSSARDLMVFGHELIKGSVLGDEMLKLLLDQDRPMGFTVTSVPLAGKEVPVVTYNGELAGATTMLTMFPDQDGTIVILSNNNMPYSALVEMTLAIAESAFGER
jgi:CubicO group peptidase (beta-lactamase class C family)